MGARSWLQFSGVSLPAPRYPVTMVIGTFASEIERSSSTPAASGSSTSTKVGGSSSEISMLFIDLLSCLGSRAKDGAADVTESLARGVLLKHLLSTLGRVG